MERKGFLTEPIKHIKIKPKMTVNELINQYSASGRFGAGRLATACDIYEKMLRDEECTIHLGLSGAVVPAGLRKIIADLIRKRMIDVIVSTGANMIHDFIEAVGGHHYKGHWCVDDSTLYKYHLYRIYDIFVPEEDFTKADEKFVQFFGEIGREFKGKSLATHEFAWELGKRLEDPNSILRSAYEMKVPIFMPAARDCEFSYVFYFHNQIAKPDEVLRIDSFKEVPIFIDIFKRSERNGMIIIGGGVPRNTIQHAAVTAETSIDYAIVITMDRQETGGLSGSTLEETVSWGKVKGKADKVMVTGEAVMVFPIIVASVMERLGENFVRGPHPRGEEG